ncbi:MAG: prevent-host-death protein [Terriglobales bacterium]
MGTLRVGVREFRNKLAAYLLQAGEAVAITRRGNTVGFYIPATCKRTQAQRVALEKAASRLHEILASEGIIEDENLVGFKRWAPPKRK